MCVSRAIGPARGGRGWWEVKTPKELKDEQGHRERPSERFARFEETSRRQGRLLYHIILVKNRPFLDLQQMQAWLFYLTFP